MKYLSRLLSNITSPKITNTQLLWLFILTIALTLISGLFEVPGIINSPQFTSDIKSTWIKEEFLNTNIWYKISYYGYFIIDCFWPFFLLLVLWKFVKRQLLYSGYKKASYKTLLYILYTIIIIGAFFFDIIENGIYFFKHNYPETISLWKIILYAGSLFGFLIAGIAYLLEKDMLSTIKTFITSSIYSLIILGLIGFILPKASQINSIVVDLYETPYNMVLLLVIFAPLLSMILVHYPSYFSIKEEYRDWYLNYKTLPIFGIITYKYKAEYKNHKNRRPESNVNFLLRILGVMFYTSLFYLIAYTSEINFKWLINTSDLAMCILACGILWLYILRLKKQHWYNSTYTFILSYFPTMYDGDYSLNNDNLKKNNTVLDSETMTPDQCKPVLHSINPIINRGALFVLLTIVFHIIFFVILYASEEKYTLTTVILSLVCIIFQMITYVYYRTFRSILKFVFFTDKSKIIINSFGGASISDLKAFFKTYNFSKNNTLFKLLTKLRAGILSDNYSFLKFIVIVANINLVGFIIINIYSHLSFKINAIVIILSALLIYYGIIVIITKNLIYYQYSKKPTDRRRFNVKFGLLVIGLIALILNSITKMPKFDNNLFTLNAIPEDNSIVDLDTFLNDRKPDLLKTRYYVGCYGGGVKSNAWTMTVLHALQQQDSNFLKQTIAISGVSGGTMGLTNLSSIIYNTEEENYLKKIDILSTQNILGLDLTHILGRDLVMHLFVPKYNLSGLDRSSSAMRQYAKMANSTAYNEKISFRSYWKEIYENEGNRYPILIANTTNVKGNQGMAVSVSTKDNSVDKQLLYQGADDILSIGKDSTLTFYDAASTSNRFPVISPAAKIETLGHYNDGGIYENSGLLSTYKLYATIANKEEIPQPKCNVFISIVNDKVAYIKSVIEKEGNFCKAKLVNKNSELNAILSSVAATEMMPIYVKEQLKRLERKDSTKVKFKTIYLPHQFNVADVKSIYGRELNCNNLNEKELNEKLYNIVKKNNDTITKYTNNGTLPIIEPPMSRVITKRAYKFMKEMLKHPKTKKDLENILNTNK
jgi:hypothetical protein